MSLEEIAPLREAFLARRKQPAPALELRRQGFETQMGGLPLPEDFKATPVQIAPHLPGLLCSIGEPTSKNVLIWLHGGAFVLGSSASYRPFAARLAAATDAQILVLDYRLAPEHVFPAALDDTIAALDWLEEEGYPADKVAIGGDSAGANLALAAMQARIIAGEPAPRAAWLISPYLDLTHSGKSIHERAARDPFVDATTMEPTARTYLGEAAADDPRASPLFGSAAGLPPIMIQVGSEEVLFDDAARLRDAISASDGQCVFQEWAGMIHVWPIFAHAVEEGRWAIAQGGNFLRQQWTNNEV